MLGDTAGDKAVREAVARIEAMEDGALVPKTKYSNCGRKRSAIDGARNEKRCDSWSRCVSCRENA